MANSRGHGIIYICRNKINNKVYVGQTIYPLKRRINAHYGTLNNEKLKYIFVNALRKYNKNDFEWKIIEKCSKILLNERESYWIKFFKSNNRKFGYNGTEGGGGCRGMEVSKETREKMRNKKLGRKLSKEHTKKIGDAHRGQKRSKETCEKIKEGRLKNGGYKSPDEQQRLQISKTLGGSPFIAKNIYSGLGYIFNTIHEAGRKLELQPTKICAVLKGRRESINTWKFEYIKNKNKLDNKIRIENKMSDLDYFCMRQLRKDGISIGDLILLFDITRSWVNNRTKNIKMDGMT